MTLTHKTGFIALAVALMAAALLMPPTAASADDAVGEGVVALVGTAHLSDGINSSKNAPGCLGGLAVGAGTQDTADGLIVADPTATPNAFAQFTYNNTDIDGDATGELHINGLDIPPVDGEQVHADFDWIRIGANAVVTLSGNENGVAVAALLPADLQVANFECGGKKKDGTSITHPATTSNYTHAQVVGVGVILSALD